MARRGAQECDENGTQTSKESKCWGGFPFSISNATKQRTPLLLRCFTTGQTTFLLQRLFGQTTLLLQRLFVSCTRLDFIHYFLFLN